MEESCESLFWKVWCTVLSCEGDEQMGRRVEASRRSVSHREIPKAPPDSLRGRIKDFWTLVLGPFSLCGLLIFQKRPETKKRWANLSVLLLLSHHEQSPRDPTLCHGLAIRQNHREAAYYLYPHVLIKKSRALAKYTNDTCP